MDVLAKDVGKIYRFLRNFYVSKRLILVNDNLLLIGPPITRDMYVRYSLLAWSWNDIFQSNCCYLTVFAFP